MKSHRMAPKCGDPSACGPIPTKLKVVASAYHHTATVQHMSDKMMVRCGQ